MWSEVMGLGRAEPVGSGRKCLCSLLSFNEKKGQKKVTKQCGWQSAGETTEALLAALLIDLLMAPAITALQLG